MKEISMFDVIGPEMIGPSSSHTAGALRISLLAKHMMRGKITQVRFVLYGSFARTYQGHGTDRALVGGILGFHADDPRIRDSFQIAREQGLSYSFELDLEDTDVHPNTVDIYMTGEDGKTTSVRGVSVGGGSAVITQLNGVNVHLSGEYNTILIRQEDKPGVLAHITSCLSEYEVNIAFMRMFRQAKGEIAYTIVETDQSIPEEAIARMEMYRRIHSAILIEI